MGFVVPDGARLVRALGAGSVFEVALIERQGLRCVCKRLKPRLLAEPLALASFERECAVVARLKHPSIPSLIERGSDAGGPYVVETELDGVPLRSLIEGRTRALPRGLLSAVARAAFETLAELHDKSDDEGPLAWVHGDLGPDHLLVGRTRGRPGRVGFADFGMSLLRGDAAIEGARGTLPYVAPEIARGDAPPDQAGDVFALAASFAFALLGRDPCHSREEAARLVEIAERGVDIAALAPLRPDDPALVDALSGALAFDRASRTSGAREVLAALSAG